MNILMNNELDFKALEEEVFKYVCNIGTEIIKSMLIEYDNHLAKTRDTKKYRHKGLRKNTIKTVMGEVEYQRVMYKYIDEDGIKKYKYLLDETLNMDVIGKMSGMLVEKALESVAIASYRKSANNVSSLTGQSISHGAIWNLVQKFGEKLVDEEKLRVEQFKNGELKGDKEVPVMFMESDGLWLSMQGDDRPKGKKKYKREIKIGIHYEGWELRSNNLKKKSYILKNKCAVAGFTTPHNFKLLRDSSIAAKYDYDEIKHRILNGDGASWINHDHDAEGDCFQLDRYHISKAILRNIKDIKEAQKLWKLFKKQEYEALMERLNELKYECGGVYEEVKKIEDLETYLTNNAEGIAPYQSKINIQPTEEGLYYRNLGAMEPNVFNILGYRMKKQKMSWSIKGANNLAKILAVKINGELYTKISSLLKSDLSEKSIEIFETVIKNVDKNVKKKIKKANIYPVHEGGTPFKEAAVTSGRKAIRKMLENKPVTELIYR